MTKKKKKAHTYFITQYNRAYIKNSQSLSKVNYVRLFIIQPFLGVFDAVPRLMK